MEEALAAFLGKEACHVTSAGYLACVCSLSSLVQRGDILLVDPSIHSSLWDGALLSGAKIERFAHEDMDSLANTLDHLDPKQAKAIAVDGVYSMEGHIASLPRLCELAEQHHAALVVDDAHGFGDPWPRRARRVRPVGRDGARGPDRGQFFEIAGEHGWVCGGKQGVDRVPAE